VDLRRTGDAAISKWLTMKKQVKAPTKGKAKVKAMGSDEEESEEEEKEVEEVLPPRVQVRYSTISS
jgi:hypothetical protein